MSGAKPLNDRQRRVAELVVSGRPGGRAYEEAGYSARGNNADAEASKLLKQPQMVAYMETLRAEARQRAKMGLDELQEFLADAIRTPIGQVDESHPLCQEYVRVQEKGGQQGKLKRGAASEGNEVSTPEQEVIKIRSVDKLRAAGLLIGINGWNKPVKVEGTITLAGVLDRINESPLPSGNESP